MTKKRSGMIFITYSKKQVVVHLAHKDKTSICVIADETDVFILPLNFYSEQQLTSRLVITERCKFK